MVLLLQALQALLLQVLQVLLAMVPWAAGVGSVGGVAVVCFPLAGPLHFSSSSSSTNSSCMGSMCQGGREAGAVAKGAAASALAATLRRCARVFVLDMRGFFMLSFFVADSCCEHSTQHKLVFKPAEAQPSTLLTFSLHNCP